MAAAAWREEEDMDVDSEPPNASGTLVYAQC